MRASSASLLRPLLGHRGSTGAARDLDAGLLRFAPPALTRPPRVDRCGRGTSMRASSASLLRPLLGHRYSTGAARDLDAGLLRFAPPALTRPPRVDRRGRGTSMRASSASLLRPLLGHRGSIGAASPGA